MRLSAKTQQLTISAKKTETTEHLNGNGKKKNQTNQKKTKTTNKMAPVFENDAENAAQRSRTAEETQLLHTERVSSARADLGL